MAYSEKRCARRIYRSIRELRGKKSGRSRNRNVETKQPLTLCEVTRKDRYGNVIEQYSYLH